MGGGDGLKEVDGCVLHGVILMDALGIKPANPRHFFVPPGTFLYTRGHLFMPRGYQGASFCALGSTFCTPTKLNLHLISPTKFVF